MTQNNWLQRKQKAVLKTYCMSQQLFFFFYLELHLTVNNSLLTDKLHTFFAERSLQSGL